MSKRDDWFRNETWNDKIAAEFEAKLRRARQKDQYLRIQAGTLAPKHPEVALQLLERYFALGKSLDRAMAFAVRATALQALGRLEDAVAAYEDALQAEVEMPNVRTQASIALPYLVAMSSLSRHYDRALQVLQQYRSPIQFPVEEFKWNAAQALIASAQQRDQDAREYAKAALEAAAKDRSPFRYHAELGLVCDVHADALRRLRVFCDS